MIKISISKTEIGALIHLNQAKQACTVYHELQIRKDKKSKEIILNER